MDNQLDQTNENKINDLFQKKKVLLFSKWLTNRQWNKFHAKEYFRLKCVRGFSFD